jgi:hypothetical protein
MQDGTEIPSHRYAEQEVGRRFAVLAAFLRMGTKYGVPYLRQLAVAKLSALFPSSWTDYTGPESDGKEHVADFDIGMAPAVLALARECTVPVLLPSCLWHLTPNSGRDLKRPRQSRTLEDGRTYTVGTDVISQCIEAGWALAESRQDIIYQVCATNHSICSDAVILALRYMIRFPAEFGLLSASTSDHDQWEDFGMCNDCTSAINSAWNSEMEALWDDLPGFYNLDPWEKLVEASK